MPDQMREALENAGVDSPQPENRREAMERAFSDLESSGGDEGDSGVVRNEPTNRRTDRPGAPEPVVKPAQKGAEPIREEEPLKPLPRGKTPPAARTPPGKPGAAAAPKSGEGEQPAPVKGDRPPVSWNPQERELWGKIDPGAKAAILRREAEITKGLNESATARRFGGEFYNIIKPFEAQIRASGVTPLQAVDNLVKTAGGLQMGTAQQKAQIVANICAAYGVDLRILDALLAGRQPPPGQNGRSDSGPDPNLMAAIDQRMKPVQDFIAEVRGSRQAADQALMAETGQEAEEFAADPKNEFFEDLRQDIADILDLAANRGRQMTLQQAYDLAAAQHPEIAAVVRERADAAATAARARNFDRSRRASVSQSTGNPGGVGGKTRSNGPQGEGMRSAIERAWGDLSAG